MPSLNRIFFVRGHFAGEKGILPDIVEIPATLYRQ